MSIVGQQVWIARPGRRYHDHALLDPGVNAPVPFLVHRHDGGEIAHGHERVETGPSTMTSGSQRSNFIPAWPPGTHALDVLDVTPAEEIATSADDRYPPADFARDLRGVRRRQADMEAAL